MSDLSKSERIVFDLILEGFTNDQIAKNTGVSKSMVKIHVSSLFKKFGVLNRYELIFEVLVEQASATQ